jgi:hypothetical protein
MIEYEGEMYLTASDVAKRFHVSWLTCQQNLLSHVHACYLPGCGHCVHGKDPTHESSLS